MVGVFNSTLCFDVFLIPFKTFSGWCLVLMGPLTWKWPLWCSLLYTYRSICRHRINSGNLSQYRFLSASSSSNSDLCQCGQSVCSIQTTVHSLPLHQCALILFSDNSFYRLHSMGCSDSFLCQCVIITLISHPQFQNQTSHTVGGKKRKWLQIIKVYLVKINVSSVIYVLYV